MTPQRRGPGPSGGSPGHSKSWLLSPSWFLPPHGAVCRPGQQAEPGQCLSFLRACRGHPLCRLPQQMAPVAVSRAPSWRGLQPPTPGAQARPAAAPRPRRPAGRSRAPLPMTWHLTGQGAGLQQMDHVSCRGPVSSFAQHHPDPPPSLAKLITP